MRITIVLILFTLIALQTNAQFETMYKQGERQRSEGMYYQAIKSYNAAIGWSETEKQRNNAQEKINECAEKLNNLKIEADNAKNEAIEQKMFVEKERNTSDSLQKIAYQKSIEAKLAKDSTLYYLYLFNGKQLANQSLLTEKNDTLKAILAKQAYELAMFANKTYANNDKVQITEINTAIQSLWSTLLPDTLFSSSTIDLCLVGKQLLHIDNNGRLFLDKKPIDNQEWFNIVKYFGDSIGIVTGTYDGKIIKIKKSKELLFKTKGKITEILLDTTNNELLISSFNSQYPIFRFDNNSKSCIDSVKYSIPVLSLIQTDSSIVASDIQGNILRFNLDNLHGKPEYLLNIKNGSLAKLAYNSVLNLLVIAYEEHAHIYEYGQSLRLIQTINTTQKGPISHIEFSPNNEMCAISSIDGKILILNFQKDKSLILSNITHYYITTKFSKIRSLNFSNTSKMLCFGDEMGIHYRILDNKIALQTIDKYIGKKTLNRNQWKLYTEGLEYIPE